MGSKKMLINDAKKGGSVIIELTLSAVLVLTVGFGAYIVQSIHESTATTSYNVVK